MSRLPLSRFLSRAVTAAVLALVVPPLGATARQATSSAPPAAPAATPLFASHEPLQIRFEAAFAELRRDTGDDPEERESMMYVLGTRRWRSRSGCARGATSGSGRAHASSRRSGSIFETARPAGRSWRGRTDSSS
jgi:hypothetical protein